MKKYRYYMWTYFVLAMIVGVNAVFFSLELVTRLGRGILLGILLYREVKMLHSYRGISTHSEKEIEKSNFTEKYRPYRVKVLLIWILFAVLCIGMELAMKVATDIYFAIALLFFFLDLLFINTICPLQVLSDPKKKAVTCCCGCPCRGWDILMINTPLFFAVNSDYIYENVITMIAIILGIVTFVQWERRKYVLVVDRKVKCAHSCNLSRCIEYQNK